MQIPHTSAAVMDDMKTKNLCSSIVKKEFQAEDQQPNTLSLNSKRVIKQEYCESSTEDDVIGIENLEEAHITNKHEEYSEQFEYISKLKFNEKSTNIPFKISESEKNKHVCHSFNKTFQDSSKTVGAQNNLQR